MAEWDEHLFPILADGGSPWPSQTKNLEINTYRFLARHSALLEQCKDWLASCQDNATK